MAARHLQSGDLRFRVTIQEQGSPEQDSVTGEVTREWVDVLVNEPASIEPLSVRDYIASKAMQSTIVARIKIRYHEGLNSRMRILHGDLVYYPDGWLPDSITGREYLTAPCSLTEDVA